MAKPSVNAMTHGELAATLKGKSGEGRKLVVVRQKTTPRLWQPGSL
jgi:hypothetical protein